MKTKHSVLMVFLFCVSVALYLGGSEYEGIILEARIVTEFTVAPITINLEGVDENGVPVTYTMVLQPGAGYVDGTFPVTVGSEEVTIPEMPVRFPPLPPGLINGPGGPFASTMLSGPNTAGNALVISAVLPETVINLPEAASSATGIFNVVLNSGIDLIIEPLDFSVIDVTASPSPIPIPYPVIGMISSTTTYNMKLVFSEMGVPVYHGKLKYSLEVDNSDHPLPWSWNVSGVWDVEIRCILPGTCFADLRHTRTANQTGGTLIHATDPGIPFVRGLVAEKIMGSDDMSPNFKIQFAKRSPGGKHTLIFKDTLLDKINTQPVNNTAYIALGQWMRRMGDSSLKVNAPYTGSSPVTWTIPVSTNQKLILEWIME